MKNSTLGNKYAAYRPKKHIKMPNRDSRCHFRMGYKDEPSQYLSKMHTHPLTTKKVFSDYFENSRPLRIDNLR